MREHVIVQLTIIIAVGIGAQWLAWVLRLPSILLLLLGGIAVGPLAGLVDPDLLFGGLLFPVVSISVALILFEGGLSLRLADLSRVGDAVRNLVTLGALVSWAVAGLAAWAVLGLEPRTAALLGAILVVTGPTVILPLLRHIRPAGPAGTVLKWEGILIDPIGAMLTVLVFEAILIGELGRAPTHAGIAVLRTLLVGGAVGAAAAFALALLLRRFWIPRFLDNAVAFAAVVGAFTASNAFQAESGLLAVTVMGFVLANQKLADVEHIVEFKENLRVLLISGLFVVLGARVSLDPILAVGPAMALFLLALFLVQRPLAVFVSTLRTGLELREKIFLAAVAPRGIVAAAIASIFALELETAGYDGADLLVSATFIAIIATVALYGLAAAPLARKLRIAEPDPQGLLIVGANRIARALAHVLQRKGFRVLLTDTNRRNISAARMAGLPTYAGSILAEHVFDEIDLGGIGRFLAMTPNDWVNVLAVRRFSRVFGKPHTYQLAPQSGSDRHRESHRHLYGRILFDSDLDYWGLDQRLDAGETVKATPLTDEFDAASFRRVYGTSAVPLFVISESGKLQPVSAGSFPKTRPGDTLISLVRGPAETSPAPSGT